MRPHFVIKGYAYSFHQRPPLSTDVDYIVPYIWINITTDIAYMLNGISGGVATWVVKEPDSVINSGEIGEVRIIGESYLGGITRAPGGGYSLPPNVVVSNPGSGEHKIESIRMDADDRIVIRYESAAQS